MASRRFLPGLRALLTIGRHLASIDQSLARLADVAEGRTRVVVSTDDAPPEFDVSYLKDGEARRMEDEALRLRPLLGRDPTPDELARALDGTEWTGEDADAHRAAVVRDLARG